MATSMLKGGGAFGSPFAGLVEAQMTLNGEPFGDPVLVQFVTHGSDAQFDCVFVDGDGNDVDQLRGATVLVAETDREVWQGVSELVYSKVFDSKGPREQAMIEWVLTPPKKSLESSDSPDSSD